MESSLLTHDFEDVYKIKIGEYTDDHLKEFLDDLIDYPKFPNDMSETKYTKALQRLGILYLMNVNTIL